MGTGHSVAATLLSVKKEIKAASAETDLLQLFANTQRSKATANTLSSLMSEWCQFEKSNSNILYHLRN